MPFFLFLLGPQLLKFFYAAFHGSPYNTSARVERRGNVTNGSNWGGTRGHFAR